MTMFAPDLPRAALFNWLSERRVWRQMVPLVGLDQMISLLAVRVRPQVLPPREETCSIAEPSGRKRTTPAPMEPNAREPSPEVTLPLPL